MSVLRVATGYHTWPQIGVGASLGAVGAALWMRLGAALLRAWIFQEMAFGELDEGEHAVRLRVVDTTGRHLELLLFPE